MFVTLNEKAPAGFAMCLKSECPAASSCLRHYAADNAADEKFLTVLNPALLQPSEEGCPSFRLKEARTFGVGLSKVLESLPSKESSAVKKMLNQRFSTRGALRFRKGERPLSPEQQKAVEECFREAGASLPVEYDSTFECFEW